MAVDVVVIGDANPDLILSGGDPPRFGQAESLVDDAALTLGGSAAITAAGLARLGLTTALIAVVGDDELGALTMRHLADRGVDTSHMIVDPNVGTGVSVHLVQGDDRAIVTHLGAIATLARSQIDDAAISRCRHLHVSSVFLLDRLRPELAELLARARSNGATTSLDTNFDPAEQWHVADLLPHCDVLLPNESEAMALTSTDSIDAALGRLAASVEVCAVKRGSGGATVIADGVHQWLPSPSMPLVDSIGAGDSFDAGFIARWLVDRAPVPALSFAVACGSLSVRGSGGTPAQGTIDEATDIASSLWP